MIVIDISIDEIDIIHKIGAVRIKPKHTPKVNEICLYDYGIFQNNKFISKGKLEFPYGNALDLTKRLIEELTNEHTVSNISH